jgi:hypothetical protein
LGAAVIVWVIAYAACKEDHTRATMTIVFELLTDALLGGLMAAAMLEKWLDEDSKQKVDGHFKTKDWLLLHDWWKLDIPAGIIGALAVSAGPRCNGYCGQPRKIALQRKPRPRQPVWERPPGRSPRLAKETGGNMALDKAPPMEPAPSRSRRSRRSKRTLRRWRS